MKRHPVNEVLRVVSEHFGVSVADIRSQRRTREVHPARVWGMYLACETTGSSFEEIGRKFGGRDYTIVRMAARACAREIAQSPESARLFNALRHRANVRQRRNSQSQRRTSAL